MNRKYIELYALLGVITLCVLAVLVGRYYFDWFAPKSSHYASYIPQETKLSPPTDENLLQKEDESKNKFSEPSHKPIRPVTANGNERKIVPIEKPVEPKLPVYQDKFHFREQNFHSLGEYVSDEEKYYRTELINGLIVPTVVIDKLSKGNGISQEFFKVVYQANMIPAKILKDIVESQEFRAQIPAAMVMKEGSTANDLKNGEKVEFKAESIRTLLLLWSEGKLTPVQKAWIVGAKK